MKMERVWAMPQTDTFDVKPIGNFVRRYLDVAKISIDPFARNKIWATFTNDLNPETSAQYHLEAKEFLELMVQQNVIADLVIFDPPYSLEQCKRSYDNVGRTVTQRDTQIWMRWKDHKDLIDKLLSPTGIMLHFGWHSNGLGKKRGFQIDDLLLVSHGSGHYDTICIAESRCEKS